MADKKPKVLIVEDDMIFSLLLKQNLENLGYKVVATEPYGKRAIEMVRNHKLAFILMDIQLKGEMDGIETVAKIREFSTVPVIYITGNSDKYHYERAKKVGYFDYLIKPLTTNNLRRSIKALEKKLNIS